MKKKILLTIIIMSVLLSLFGRNLNNPQIRYDTTFVIHAMNSESSDSSVLDQNDSTMFWVYGLPGICSAVAALFSATTAVLTLLKNRPKVSMTVYPGEVYLGVEIKNLGSVRTYVKIIEYTYGDKGFVGKYFNNAWFSENSYKCIALNSRGKSDPDNRVYDKLYELEPYDVIYIYIPKEEFSELLACNGGILVKEVSGTYLFYDGKHIYKRRRIPQRNFS